MDCKNFGHLLDEYENLTAMQKAELIEHTQNCEECRKEYELFISMLEATKTIPPIKVDDSFLKNLNTRIDKEIVNAPVHKNVWEHMKLNAHRYSAAAACVALIAVIGVNNSDLLNKFMNPYQDPQVVPAVATESEITKEDDVAGLIITSTIEPTQSPKPTEAPLPTNAATHTPAVVTTSPSIEGYRVAVATPKPVQQTPAATTAPVVTATPDTGTQAPTPQETNTQNEPNYVMPTSNYELPEKERTNGQNNSFSSEYNFENTSNYLKVSSADMERVRGLVSEFSKDSSGDVYLVSEDDLKHLLAILSNEGIEFGNCSLGSVVNGNIAFKLIIS